MKTFLAFTSGTLLCAVVFLLQPQLFQQAEPLSHTDRARDVATWLDTNPKLVDKITVAIEDKKISNEEYQDIKKFHESIAKILENHPDLEIKNKNSEKVQELKSELHEIMYGMNINLESNRNNLIKLDSTDKEST